MWQLTRISCWALSLLWLNTGFAQKYGCPPGVPNCQYVYKIEIKRAGSNDSPTVMTGFKVNDNNYLITALHGIIDVAVASGSLGKTTIYALQNENGPEDKFDHRYKMELCGFDSAKDLAYLCFKDDSKSIPQPGIDFTGKVTSIKEDDQFNIYGFHTQQIQVKKVTPDKTAIRKIKTILNLTEEQAARMKSPDPTQEVMVLGSHDVNSGGSGGPIVLINKGVNAVGSGARTTILSTGSGKNDDQIDQTVSWAIILSAQDIKLKAPIRGNDINSKFDKMAKVIVEARKNIGYKLSYTEHSQKPAAASTDEGTQLVYPKVKPRFLIGGTLSWTYLLKPTGLTLRQRPGDRNTFLDIYVERRILPWLYVGAYGSSPYLQYELLRQFDNNLPLYPDAIRTSAKGVFRYAGGQFSLVASGAFWQYYLGAGGLPIQIGKVRSNYRAYAGVRHYLFARRWLAVEGRIVYIKPDEPIQPLRPRLGNALTTDESKNLLNLNVCAGICIAL